jgi:hypothetical protein
MARICFFKITNNSPKIGESEEAMRKIMFIAVLFFGIVMVQKNVQAQSAYASMPAVSFWDNLLIRQGAGQIEGVIHSNQYSANMIGYSMQGSPDPYSRAYFQKMEQLRAQEFQRWQRARELKGYQDAEKDFQQGKLK